MTLMSALTVVLLHKYFKDTDRFVPQISAAKSISPRRQLYNELANTPVCFGRMTTYTACLIACMILNASTKGPMACFETLGIEFAETRFGMYRAQAGSIVATMGLLGVVNLMAMRVSFNKHDDTKMICGGIIVFVAGVAMNLTLDGENPDDNSSWRYIASMFLCYAVGYPICHTALIGLFSKIVGRRPQGTLQGLFSASGSVARVVFPVMSGYVVSFLNIEILFTILVIVLCLSLLFVVASRETLTQLAV